MARRSYYDLVNALITVLKEQEQNNKDIISQGELCEALKINSRTANDLLQTIELIQKDCPQIELDQVSKFTIIKILSEKRPKFRS